MHRSVNEQCQQLPFSPGVFSVPHDMGTCVLYILTVFCFAKVGLTCIRGSYTADCYTAVAEAILLTDAIHIHCMEYFSQNHNMKIDGICSESMILYKRLCM